MTSLDREEVQKPISSFEDMFLNIITTAVENAIENTVGPRLEAVETRLDRIDARLDSLEGRLTEVHESLADQITKQGQAINRRFDAMGTRSE